VSPVSASSPPSSVAELRTSIDAGARPEFLFFYGHRAPADDTPGPWCLSQWYPAPFTVDGREYATAEHYMMAGKALLFDDLHAAEAIHAAPTPAAAKRLGRQVRGFDEERWARQRFEIVVRGNLAKFTQHEDMAAFLLGTGQRVLVEAAPRDRVWGIGLSADDPRTADPDTWHGMNLLGFALMSVRHQLASVRP
jgi:ribA/ribD-fused uncharacterized protein